MHCSVDISPVFFNHEIHEPHESFPTPSFVYSVSFVVLDCTDRTEAIAKTAQAISPFLTSTPHQSPRYCYGY